MAVRLAALWVLGLGGRLARLAAIIEPEAPRPPEPPPPPPPPPPSMDEALAHAFGDQAGMLLRLPGLAARCRHEASVQGPGILLLDSPGDQEPAFLSLAALEEMGGMPRALILRTVLQKARKRGTDPARDAVIIVSQHGSLALYVVPSQSGGMQRVEAA